MSLCSALLTAGTQAAAESSDPCLDATGGPAEALIRVCSDQIAALTFDRDSGLPVTGALASAHSNRALGHQADGDYEGALADFDTALALLPNSAAILLNRGNLRLQQGDPTGALADYARVQEVSPSLAEAALRNSVLAYRALGRPLEAEALAAQLKARAAGALNNDPASPELAPVDSPPG
ncbi:MAG: tetratricopeptide repeat protein [Pseudomonadota bacterium]